MLLPAIASAQLALRLVPRFLADAGRTHYYPSNIRTSVRFLPAQAPAQVQPALAMTCSAYAVGLAIRAEGGGDLGRAQGSTGLGESQRLCVRPPKSWLSSPYPFRSCIEIPFLGHWLRLDLCRVLATPILNYDLIRLQPAVLSWPDLPLPATS